MHATRPSHPRIRMACFAIVTVGSIAYSTKFARELTAAPTVVVPRTTSPSIGVALPNVEPGPVAREVVAAPVSKATAKRVVAATPERVSPRPPQQDTLPPDRNVMEMPGLPTPRYPDILKQAGLGGGVLVAFVVDTNGVADPESMKVFISTHELFTASVKAALPNMHFLPAILNGKKVFGNVLE